MSGRLAVMRADRLSLYYLIWSPKCEYSRFIPVPFTLLQHMPDFVMQKTCPVFLTEFQMSEGDMKSDRHFVCANCAQF